MTWTRGPIVGRGSSATVSLATAHPSGQVFVVKSADLSQSELLKREQNFLCKLNCPQIVAYRGCDTTLENGNLVYNLFMEYAAGGDVIRRGGRLDEAAIVSYARQVLLGLEYLHSCGIVHCDIKGQNILVAEDGVKVADLGCAKWASDADAPIAGTPLFMAPEVARGEQQGFAADIWAFGCTVIEMATGRAPWGEVSDPVSALYRIGYSGEVPEIPSFMSKQGRDFLGKCLMTVPGERWSAKELLKHAFVEGPTKFVFNDIGGFDSDTPTGVLDQALWGSMSMPTAEIIHPTQLLNSPAERIRQLSGAAVAAEWDENDWVTVRSNESGEEGRGSEGVTETVEESEEDNGELINGNDSENGQGAMSIGGKDSCESNCGQENNGTFVCNKDQVTCRNLNFQNINEQIVGFISRLSFNSFLRIIFMCKRQINNEADPLEGPNQVILGGWEAQLKPIKQFPTPPYTIVFAGDCQHSNLSEGFASNTQNKQHFMVGHFCLHNISLQEIKNMSKCQSLGRNIITSSYDNLLVHSITLGRESKISSTLFYYLIFIMYHKFPAQN